MYPRNQRPSGTCAQERNARRASAVPGADTHPLALQTTELSDATKATDASEATEASDATDA